jgi:hypothetical protein
MVGRVRGSESGEGGKESLRKEEIAPSASASASCWASGSLWSSGMRMDGERREKEMESEPEAERWVPLRSSECWDWEEGDLFGCGWREPEQLDIEWDW